MSDEIYTIGHSTQPIAQFTSLLKQYGIELVVDVRSQPFSRFASHFNQRTLEGHLHRSGIGYRYMGRELGGKPEDPSLQSSDGHPDYDKIERSALFQQGLRELLTISQKQKLTLLCSEADPMECHREKLLARAIRLQGVRVVHILSDGSLGEQKQGVMF